MSTIAETITIDNVRVHCLSRMQLLSRFQNELLKPSDAVFVGFYASLLIRAAKDSDYHRALDEAHTIYADGAGLVLAMRLLHPSGPRERLATTDIWEDLAKVATDLKLSIAFIGSNAETSEAFVDRLASLGASVVYARHGYFSDPEERTITAMEVRASGAELVLVGMGAGAQESFCRLIADQAGTAQTFVTVGGLADHVTGSTRRAPIVIQKAGLEWAWRVAQEPRRLYRRYLVGNVYFVARLFSVIRKGSW